MPKERSQPVKTLLMKNQRLVQPISPLWLGIGISGSLLALFLVTETALGRWAELLVDGEFSALADVSSGVLRDVRIAIVHCLIIGYLPAAFLHVLRSGRRTVFVLQRALDCTVEECEVLASSVRLSTARLITIAAIPLALSFLAPYMVSPVPTAPWSPSSWSPEVVWHRILGPAQVVWAWWLGYAIVTVSVRMTRIAKKLRRIDLFNLSPLTPFTQQGLTNALLVIGAVSVWSLMLLETGFGQMMWVVGGINLVVAAIALLSPVYGVHKRIHKAKEEELGRANREISEQRNSLHDPGATRQYGKLADLVAYRGLIESISEWPFTASTYTRIALYTLLPLLTWTVGLIAEELIGQMLIP